MEPFYLTPDQFWDWFNQVEDKHSTGKQQRYSVDEHDDQQAGYSRFTGNKRMKTDNKPKSIADTEAAYHSGPRYIILYGRHKPGKKSKVWEADGYLTLVGQMAHLCDLKGRLLEEPTILDDIDYNCVKELGELTIGDTEVQVIEEDKS